jgi:hypothetical protein
VKFEKLDEFGRLSRDGNVKNASADRMRNRIIELDQSPVNFVIEQWPGKLKVWRKGRARTAVRG